MPTVQESRLLLKYLEFWSKVYIFPFEVLPSSGRLFNLTRGKKGIWNILYFLSVSHSIYNFAHTLALYLFYRERVVLYHLPVEFCGGIAPLLFHLAYMTSLLSNPGAIKLVFNELFDSQESHPNQRKWKELSIAEFFGIYAMTAMITCVYFEYLAIICIESSMSHLIINISPLEKFRSNVIFIAFAYFCEAYFSAMWFVHAGFFLSLNCLVISKVESTMKDIQTNPRSRLHLSYLRNSFGTARNNQLYIQIFNIFNAWFLHCCKTCIIIASIIEGFIGLRYQSQPLVVVFCICCHFGCIVTYYCTFQRGYSAVVRQQEAKRAMLSTSRNIRAKVIRRKVLSTLRSLHCVGIRVGQFHEIERNSLITFVDYVERQVMGLLIAF